MWEDPWCLGGDFNVLRYSRERNGEERWTRAMRRFSQVLDDLVLKDLPLQGGVFTWSGGPRNQRLAKLDRFLVTDEWENYFGNMLQSILPRPLSNHHSILLKGGGSAIRGPMPFKFENLWLKEEGFKGLIWKSFELSGISSFRVAKNLKALKLKLKNWNKEIFERVEERKIQALQKVAFWDTLGPQRPLT